jgi:dTDP-4-amino-4,6-dideoxygalactose transaminase
VYTGAKPVFVDIELDTFSIDPDRIEEKITPRTKAILPVHLFGHAADMGKIMAIARKHDLAVIEDCAQAFGASWAGRKVGSFGDAGCFSFYPSKNLGAFGDAGIITLNAPATAERIRLLRNHGSRGAYVHDSVGFNSRLDELQAGVLLVKLKRIDGYNRKRAEKAALYTSLLEPTVRRPQEKAGAGHVYNLYTIMSGKRDEIQARLKQEGVSSVVYYPAPLHVQKALDYLGCKQGDFPLAERAAREVLSLPMYPEIEEDVVRRIASIVNSVHP